MTKILLLGATGACGRHVVKSAIYDSKVSSIRCVGRRKDDSITSDKVEQVVVDMNDLASMSDDEKRRVFGSGFDTLAITLGTTRAAAGSAAEFIRIDHDIPLAAAKLFREVNPDSQHVILVTSGGSSPNSPFLYPKTKGQMEEDIKALQFPRTSILQPGFLELPPGESRPDARTLENVAAKVVPFFKSIMPTSLSQKMAISTADVGKAIVRLAASNGAGVKYYSNAEIQQIADQE